MIQLWLNYFGINKSKVPGLAPVKLANSENILS